MSQLPAPDFDLVKTLNSGQVFHWQAAGRGFVGPIGDVAVYLEQHRDTLRANGARPEMIGRYFALDHSLSDICRSFPNDDAMNAATKFCRGLRIIRQPKWECLAMFICSSMKQVAHIRQISQKLRERFGKQRTIVKRVVHTFPTAESVAHSSDAELRECALGYRAKNLLATARL